MKRAAILGAAILLTVYLAGCGPVASPSHYEYDSDTYTTTTTAAADLAQHDNRPVCVGLVVLGSCNTTATQTQTTTRPAAPARTPAGDVDLAVVCNSFLIAAAITALFVMLMTGLRGIFSDSAEAG